MGFNGSGSYTAPAGNPVVTGTVVTSTWANGLVTDIGNTFGNVLPRDGQAPMSAPLRLTDGTNTQPGITFNSDTNTGLYRPGAGLLSLTVSGTETLRAVAGRILVGTTTDDGTTKLQVNGNISATNLTGAIANLSGNLNLTGTAQRITGDFSNATVANRVMLQSSTTNGATVVGILPNGTSTDGAISVYNNSSTVNNSAGTLYANAADVRISSDKNGTGSYLPLTFYTGGAERMRVTTSGFIGIGASPIAKLHVEGPGEITAPNVAGVKSATIYVIATNNATDAGGGIEFGGKPSQTHAAIKSGITDGTTNGLGYLAFYNRATITDSAMTERLRLIADGSLIGTSTTSWQIPVGTTAQRPTAATGQLRFNNTVNQFEGYNGTAWGSIGGGATGGGSDTIFSLNKTVMTTSYTLPAGQNGSTVGPLTINSGVVLTVPSGQRMVIL